MRSRSNGDGVDTLQIVVSKYGIHGFAIFGGEIEGERKRVDHDFVFILNHMVYRK